jgi:hypothetical protein
MLTKTILAGAALAGVALANAGSAAYASPDAQPAGQGAAVVQVHSWVGYWDDWGHDGCRAKAEEFARSLGLRLIRSHVERNSAPFIHTFYCYATVSR